MTHSVHLFVRSRTSIAMSALLMACAPCAVAQQSADDKLTPAERAQRDAMERAQREAERVFSVIRNSGALPATPAPAKTPVRTTAPQAAAPAASPAPAKTAARVAEPPMTPRATVSKGAAERDDARLASPVVTPTAAAAAANVGVPPEPPLQTVRLSPGPGTAASTAATNAAGQAEATRAAARAAADSAERDYMTRLHAYLDGIKRYPTSREAREKRPSGTVRLWISVLRSGQINEAGVEASSGSMLLDQEALRSVRSGRYPPFPDNAFLGEERRRFVVGLDYALSSGQ